MVVKAKKKKISSLYIFPALFLIIFCVYIFRYMFFTVEKEIVKYDEMESSIAVEGIVVKTENIISLPGGVLTNNRINEGEKVSFGKKLMEINKSESADMNISEKINQLDNRINEMQNANANTLAISNDKEKIENSIKMNITELKSLSKSGNIERITEVKNNLASNLYKKSLISGDDGIFGKNLEDLVKEKSNLESIYKNNITVIYAQASGIVSYDLDGYEQILNPVNISSFKVSKVKEVLASIKKKEVLADTKGVKIVDNFDWYITTIVNPNEIVGLKKTSKVQIRFKDSQAKPVNAEVYYISEAENKEAILTLKINEYVKDFYKKRLVNIDIIKNYFEGFKVPIQSIVTKENIKGVYIVRNNMVKFIPIRVMTNDDKFAIIDNLEISDKSYDASKTIRVFDEVVTKVKYVRENQIVSDGL